MSHYQRSMNKSVMRSYLMKMRFFILSVAYFSNFIQSQDAKSPGPQWMYIDMQGIVQGPFSAEDMTEWYRCKYLPETLQVRRVEDSDYVTLRTLAARGPVDFYAPAKPKTPPSIAAPVTVQPKQPQPQPASQKKSAPEPHQPAKPGIGKGEGDVIRVRLIISQQVQKICF